MTFVAGEIARTLEDRNAQRTHTHRRDCRPRPAAYSAGRLVVHVRDDMGSEFSARSGADPQSKSVTLGAGPLPPPKRQEGKMNARNDIKRPTDQSLDARLVLAAAQRRFAVRVDFLVARWLERCATKAEAAQRLFKTDRKPTREFGMGVSLVVSSPRWDERGCQMAASLNLLQITRVDPLHTSKQGSPCSMSALHEPDLTD